MGMLQLSTFIGVCGLLLGVDGRRSNEGTQFAIAIPRTYHAFDGLVRLTSKEPAVQVTIENINETRQVVLEAHNAHTEWFGMEQRVTYGVEDKGIIITADSPVSVHIDQPSWEVDVSMARPVLPDDLEYYILTYVGEIQVETLWPHCFYSVVALEDNTIVEIHGDDAVTEPFELNRLEVFSQDSVEYGEEGLAIDYSGVHIIADKPVSVFAGHGRARFPPLYDSSQYLYDSMPSVAGDELGVSYTTFPVAFGHEDTGYLQRVLATVDGTEVTIPDLDFSVNLNAGEFHQVQHPTSFSSSKVLCSSPCYVTQMPIPTMTPGGVHNTSLGGGMVHLVPDSALSQDLLVALPFIDDPDNSRVMLALIVDTYPVENVYLDGQNVNELGEWYAGTNDEFAYTAITLASLSESVLHLTSEDPAEQFAAYIYTNVDGEDQGTKTLSAGFGQL